MKNATKVLSVARLSEKGQLTIPAAYRRDFALEHESTVLLMQVGGALVLVPYDEALSAVTARMEAAMRGQNASIDDLVATAEEARAEIAAEDFGYSPTDEAAG